MRKNFTVALLCGGPSLERGISLNSARSVCDHLQRDGVKIIPIYFDQMEKPYAVSIAELYSNTPSDFDFKLSKSAKLAPAHLIAKLKTADLVFPAIHGKFGEDGEVQKILERNRIPYVGSSSKACVRSFDKYRAYDFLRANGFPTFPTLLLEKRKRYTSLIERFLAENRIQRCVVKPAAGGSSIGVYKVETVSEAVKWVRHIFKKGIDDQVVVEPFCTGKEFSVVVLQNLAGDPVALLPTEIEKKADIYDNRLKYLATDKVKHYCPPRFSDEVVQEIQLKVEFLFRSLGMQDFARFDGWVLSDGKVQISADFNPISGMEQNSLLFQQCARLGLSHRDALYYIVRNACHRNNIVLPDFKEEKWTGRRRVQVLFGGSTSERQVSLMSGTNVWLKLRRSKKYRPTPFLLASDRSVWELPYALTLSHTVEEIIEAFKNSADDEKKVAKHGAEVIKRLGLKPSKDLDSTIRPKKISLRRFVQDSRLIFNCLHGGIGENGTLQTVFQQKGVHFTGSGPRSSKLCMDKFETGRVVNDLSQYGITSLPKSLRPIPKRRNQKVDFNAVWKELLRELECKTVIVKPRGDGCSTGIARLYFASDLEGYWEPVAIGAPRIELGTLSHQKEVIELPLIPVEELMFEPFFETDKIRVNGKKLIWQEVTGWIEITTGVLGGSGALKSFNPSLTVSEGDTLSLEEKFQGGVGINITPPPDPQKHRRGITKAKIRHVSAASNDHQRVIMAVKERTKKVAEALGISGYARIDAFMEVGTGKLKVIEANTNPGLTPATVIYHQALAENPPLYPIQFLERILDLAVSSKTIS